MPISRFLIITLGALYATQGLVGGMINIAMPIILRGNGVALDKIALLSLLWIPTIIKFVWSPQIDNQFSQITQKLNAAFAMQMSIIGLLLLSLFAQYHNDGKNGFIYFMLVLSALAVVVATQDIVIDALAVQSLASSQFGAASTMQIGGSYLGYLLGGGIFAWLVSISNLATAVAYIILFMLLAALLSARQKYHWRNSQLPVIKRERAVTLFNSLKQKPQLLAMLSVFILQASARFFMGIMLPFLIDSGLSVAATSLLSGSIVAISGLIGSLIGGYLYNQFKTSHLLFSAMLAYLLIQLGFLAAYKLEAHIIVMVILFLLFCVVLALSFVVVYAMMMRVARADSAGTDYTLMQCTDAICAMVFGLLAGVIAAHLSYTYNFIIGASLALFALIFVAKVMRANTLLNIE